MLLCYSGVINKKYNKIFLFFDILTLPPILNLGPFLLFSFLKSVDMASFTSAAFILMVR